MKMLICAIILLPLLGCSVKRNERFYQDRWCKDRGGQVEVRLSDKTRCDCVTRKYAIEFDYAGKWEAIEQALHYGRLTGKKPGIVFICRKKGDRKKIKRAVKNIKFYKLPIRVWRENC